MRRIGEIGKRRIDAGWPFQVEFEVPSGGLGTRLDELHRSARQIAPDYMTRPAGAGAADRVRFCFRIHDLAERFRHGAGGTLLDLSQDGR